jgi:hypothetical protein
MLSLSLLLLVTTIINALPTTTNDKSKEGAVMTIPFQKRKISSSGSSLSRKRSFLGMTWLYNDNQIQYLVNVDIGTPTPQQFTVILDTGRLVAQKTKISQFKYANSNKIAHSYGFPSVNAHQINVLGIHSI